MIFIIDKIEGKERDQIKNINLDSANTSVRGNSRSSLTGHQRANSNPEKISTASYLDEEDYGIRLVGRKNINEEDDSSAALMTTKIISKIHAAIPSRFRLCTQWRLIYSTAEDGFSLGSLFSHCKHHHGPTLIVVRDDGDCLFGVFATEPWKPHFGHYGTGECFLWRRCTTDANDGRIQKWGSTGKNAYFTLSERDYLAAGCGDGKFGFWVDEELLNGQSYPVATFDNEVLGSRESFKCINLELWGLDMTPFGH